MHKVRRRARASVRVADEVWITAALLHREFPEREDFTVAEILDRARREVITTELRPGVYPHIVQHCVANRPPSPARYRMLFETREGSRRLFRYPDAYHFYREDGKILPLRSEIPAEHGKLLDWYATEYQLSTEQLIARDPLLRLRGSGKALWADESPDDYVRRLREGWE